MNEALLSAIEIAAIAHRGQVDGAGRQYLLHSLAVLRTVAKKLPKDTDAQMAAVLHDVLEDTSIRAPSLLLIHGVSYRAVSLVEAVTRKPDETYEQFIDRVADTGPVAIVIKLSDLEHNLSRIDGLPAARRAKLKPRYQAAKEKLTAALKYHNGVDHTSQL
jgi:(p)ppGpp synthase/HD superfamily hydrolase